jgi:hypothetical protein
MTAYPVDIAGHYRFRYLMAETRHSLIYSAVEEPGYKSVYLVRLLKREGRNPQAIDDYLRLLRTLLLKSDLFLKLSESPALPDEIAPQYTALVHPTCRCDLYTHIQTTGPIPEVSLCPIICHTLEAIAYLHGTGFRHCAICPEHILLIGETNSELTTVVTGLGLAQPFAAGQTSDTPLEKTVYAAPEIHRGERCTFNF